MRANLDTALLNFEYSKFNKLDKKNLEDKKLKELTNQFEAFLIKKVLDISLPKNNPLFPKDAGDKIYRSMYNDTLSQTMSGHFGFSELLYNFLKEKNK